MSAQLAGSASHNKTIEANMKISTSRKAGFTLVEISIVVALIGMLAAIALPNTVHARTNSQAKTCINNLRQIDSAIQQWALEAKQPPRALVNEADVTPYLKNMAICPAGGTSFSDSYQLTDVASGAVCLKAPATHFL